jgi:superfamily II DNA/RNA helicase
MKPEANATNILSTTRATAKMHEFRVAPEDFIALPRDPSMLFDLAVGLLGDIAATIANQFSLDQKLEEVDASEIPAHWDEDAPSVAEGLKFASVFFDAYLNAKLDQEISTEFSLLCASAYYLSANVGSATVIVRNMALPPLELAGGLARLLYTVLRNEFKPVEGDHAHAAQTTAVLNALAGFVAFDSGREDVAAACDNMRGEFYKAGSPRELLYSDLVASVCALKIHNASRTILPATSGLEAEVWRAALAKAHFPFELWPAQQRIASAGLLRGESAVIQMPTSAGKTRATELIIRAAFLSGRAKLAVIVAPYRSLCHDIRSDLVAAFAGESIRLDEASDSFQFDLVLEELLAVNSVLIVTPEKLLYMLRRAPELVARIGLIIYDEGHQFDGLTRGPTYELLLTTLRITLPADTQIILISAVIGNANAIAEWLIGNAGAVIDGAGLLPTSKSVAFASWQDARGRLEYVSPADPEEREFWVPRVIADFALAKLPRERTERRFPLKDDGGDVGLFLGLHVVRNGSVAIFCGRKDSAAKICRRAVEVFARGAELPRPIDVSDQAEIEKLRFLSENHLGTEAGATKSAALGIFAHHADTPQGLRLAIEHAMKEGLAKFVICTSTLAQGVNFPLKYLIVTSIRQAGDKILVRDFQNLMGRAGRAGMHTEGSVIFSTPSLYDQRLQFRNRWRWDEAKDLLDASKSEPSRSSILALFDDYVQRQKSAPPVTQEMRSDWLDLAFADRDRIEIIVNEALALQPNISAAEFRKFIEGRARVIQAIAAFLVSNMTFLAEEGADRVSELAANTLAHHLAEPAIRGVLVAVFQMIADAIAVNTDGDQRMVIRKSPLPPAVIADLQAWLVGQAEPLREAIDAGNLLDFVAEKIISHSSSPSIRSLSSGLFLPEALAAWVIGRPYQAIHARMHELEIKVSGNHATVEDAVALCENGFAYDLAMITASMADLTEAMDGNLHTGFATLQKQIKYGLTDPAAIAFVEAGMADRVVASALSVVWPNVRDRAGVRAAFQNAQVREGSLSAFPAYFSAVASEIAAA